MKKIQLRDRPNPIYKCTDENCNKNILIPCNNISKNGWTCTREKDHIGNHIACGSLVHNIESWENND